MSEVISVILFHTLISKNSKIFFIARNQGGKIIHCCPMKVQWVRSWQQLYNNYFATDENGSTNALQGIGLIYTIIICLVHKMKCYILLLVVVWRKEMSETHTALTIPLKHSLIRCFFWMRERGINSLHYLPTGWVHSNTNKQKACTT